MSDVFGDFMIADAVKKDEELDRLRSINGEMYEALEAILPLAANYLRNAPSDPDNAKLEDARAILARGKAREQK